MLVWLASYPRSGNHLLRTILKNSFDLGSYEIYQPKALMPQGEEGDLVGVLQFRERKPTRFLARARRRRDLFLVKTHDPVPDADRCIYILRDGRAALYSYARYRREVVGVHASLRDVVSGTHWPGLWADHIEQFLDRGPARTLVLRYEELASGNPPLGAIEAFLDQPIKRPFDVSFGRMNALDPVRYARGQNAEGVAVVEAECSADFWFHNGAAMRRAGYDAAGDIAELSFGTGKRIQSTAGVQRKSFDNDPTPSRWLQRGWEYLYGRLRG